ncbi:nuclear transport factor 2 family protein [Pseudonocardia spinosispora]|uniref:nuclear transport factor 2 family protein n=1 Tax=Pseudonocardia spinosispora TaxID=103441 RepID=UPI00040C6DF5|nr:nuclear transport factor 2 family protein [Pseudonocardia spinosispora]
MPTAHSLFRTVDDHDTDGLRALLAEDARMVFGNQEPLLGRDAVMAGDAAFHTSIRGVSHRVRNEWTVGTTTIAETDVTYTRLDGAQVTVPAVTIWSVDGDDLIADLRVFVDLSPVHARP